MKSKNFNLKILALSSLILFPTLVLADFTLAASDFKGVVYYIIDLLDLLIPLLSGIAFIVFFWGLSKFILNADNKIEIDKGKSYMFWGVIALFILLSFRTIIGLLSNEFEFGNSAITPTLNTNAQTPVTSGRVLPP